MKKLKIVFNGLYFAYLFVSLIVFLFRESLFTESANAEVLSRFLNFWIILGFFFFIGMWIIQTAHVRYLQKDIDDVENELHQVKLRLYDLNKQD